MLELNTQRTRFSWKGLAIVALSLCLAWGMRGLQGHERGAALAGAMVALSLAAVTGSSRWMGAAVLGSLCFATGGALSYGRFIQPAFEGSWQAIAALVLIGAAWGGMGALGLILGLTFKQHRRWERILIALYLLVVWFCVDQLLWARVTGPDDLLTRIWMAVILFGSWVLLTLYVVVSDRDWSLIRLSLAGAVGLGIGFPLSAWIQGVAPITGLAVDWWKIAEHAVGLCGGLAIGWAGLTLDDTWQRPAAIKPWERWVGFVWLFWCIPSWLMANNLDYWIEELTLLPVSIGNLVGTLLMVILFILFVWGFINIRQGRRFVTSWMPAQLRVFFLF